MADLSTTYLGLSLRNPVIVSSSGLTGTLPGVKRCADAGAGAVVLKSLFEEQIDAEMSTQEEEYEVTMHPEATEYVQQMGKHIGPTDYLKLVEDAKKSAGIPIIASVNCVSSRWWTDYARQIQDAGADAIELNLSLMPRSFSQPAQEVERSLARIIEEVRKQVTIPIAAKIGPYFTSLPYFATQLRRAGLDAMVLFNRFYQLDIDVGRIELTPGYQFSAATEIHQTLRWVSILYDHIGCDLSASTGVHEGTDAVKLLLAGAQSVQVCSVLYRKSVDHIATITKDIAAWMDDKGFKTIGDFRGKLSQAESSMPQAYERLQYIKALTGLS